MSIQCQNCRTPNPLGARYCQGCGRLLGATNVQGRTVVMPSSLPVQPMTAAQEKTVVQRVEQTYGRGATSLGPAVPTLGSPRQRELMIILNDQSGSMAENFGPGITKQEAAIRASINLVLNKARLDDLDEIGLVVFNDKAQVLMEPQPIRSHKSEMIRVLQSLSPGGGTDTNKGLVAAGNLCDLDRRDIILRIALLSDGHGGHPIRTAEGLKSRGVVIDVIGIGETPDDVNEKLLKQVASVIQGELRYRFIKDHQTLVAHYTLLANKTKTI